MPLHADASFRAHLTFLLARPELLAVPIYAHSAPSAPDFSASSNPAAQSRAAARFLGIS